MTIATHEKCSHCGAWQRIDVLGPVCTSCGRCMVDSVENRTPAKNDTPAPSPIVGRRVFKSASLRELRDPAGICPLLKS
jgi:hypothetical protein